MARSRPTALALAVGLAAGLASLPNGALADPNQADLDRVTALGRQLAQYDANAADSTDAVMALRPPRSAMGLYVGLLVNGQWVFTFGHLDESQQAFLIAYEARRGDTGRHEVSALDPAKADTGAWAASARAQTAAESDFARASHPAANYNIASLIQPDGTIYVYLYPGQTSNAELVYGADWRYTYSSDGRTLIERRQLHKALLRMTLGGNAVAGVHSDILSDIPVETDVFWVLLRQPAMPEYVSAGGWTFKIATDGSITTVQKLGN